jgi:Fe-S-cluster containining protein
MTPLEEVLQAHALHMQEIAAACEGMAQHAEADGRPIQCRSGCAACCAFRVEIGALEAREIALHLRMNGRDTPGLRLKLASAAKFGQKRNPEQHFAAGRACPLLDERGRCTVYEVRPAACRIHNVTTDPARCARLDGAERIEIPGLLDAHARFCVDVAAAVDIPGPAFGHLPALVAFWIKKV